VFQLRKRDQARGFLRRWMWRERGRTATLARKISVSTEQRHDNSGGRDRGVFQHGHSNCGEC
jgi:hypothetical protein